MKSSAVVPIEVRTARLTILINPQKKAVFERLCAEEDLTPSRVLRRLIRAPDGCHFRIRNRHVGRTSGRYRGAPRNSRPARARSVPRIMASAKHCCS
jgi:hypothetical protein